MSNPQDIIQQLADKLNFNYDDLDFSTPKGREEFLWRFLISKRYSPEAVAVLMAQAAHESDSFRTMKEYGQLSYFKKYDNRKDLGHNGEAGIGAKYRGRGYVQLTGKSNYDKVGKFLGIDLLNHPEIAENPIVAVYIFDWFIHHGNKFKSGTNVAHWAEKGDVEKTTRLINGGTNGLSDRLARYKHYRNKIGILTKR